MAFSLAVSLSLLLTMRTDGLRSFLGLLNKLCSTSAAWRIVAVVSSPAGGVLGVECWLGVGPLRLVHGPSTTH